MYSFEKFTQRKFKAYADPKITITKDRGMNFNAMAMKDYIKTYNFAVLYYDKKNKLIGIKLTNTDSPEAYKIRKQRKGNLGGISMVSFMKYYNIKHDKTLNYTIQWEAQDEMIIIDLREHEKKRKILNETDDREPNL